MKIKLLLITIVLLLFVGVPESKAFFSLNMPEFLVGSPTYEEAYRSDKPMVIFFYVNWCSGCKKFVPKLEALRTRYEGSYNFVKINAEDSKYVNTAKAYGIFGYPTMYIVDPVNGRKQLIDFSYFNNVEGLQNYLDNYLKNRKVTKKK